MDRTPRPKLVALIAMAWTQSDIDALKQAMATGVKRAEFGSGETRRVHEFRTLAEMQIILAQMEAELLLNLGLASRRTVAGYCSGL